MIEQIICSTQCDVLVGVTGSDNSSFIAALTLDGSLLPYNQMIHPTPNGQLATGIHVLLKTNFLVLFCSLSFSFHLFCFYFSRNN